MTTNQELREQLKAMRVSKLHAESERDHLRYELDKAERYCNTVLATSFVVVLSLLSFVIVSDLVG